MSTQFLEADVQGWKISRVVEEARKVGVDNTDVSKLMDEEVNGYGLLSRINDGTLENVISSKAAQALTSIIQFPAGKRTTKEIEEELAEVKKQLRAFSFIDVWGVQSHASKSSNSRTRMLFPYFFIDECAQFRASLVNYYELGHEKCMVTGNTTDKLTAGHIWPSAQSKHPSFLGLGFAEADVDNARNGLLLLTEIEKAFDRKDICFLYNHFNPNKFFLGKFIVKVLNPALLGDPRDPLQPSMPCAPGGPTFADINGQPVTLPDGKFPFRRLLNTHARAAYRNALLAGWITRDILENFVDYARLSDTATQGPVDEDLLDDAN